MLILKHSLDMKNGKNLGSIPFSACTVTDEENRHRQALKSFHRGEILSLAFLLYKKSLKVVKKNFTNKLEVLKKS
jgi:hypothetical protein